MTRTIITALAALASGLACEALPAEVVEKAKVCILDALGMGVGGVNIDNAKVAHRAFGALAAPGAARASTCRPRRSGRPTPRCATRAAISSGTR